MTQRNTQESTGLDRRALLRRAGVVGAGATIAWATPTVQSLAKPPFATGSALPSACWITGGGKQLTNITGPTGTYLNAPADFSLGVGRIDCPGPGPGNSNDQFTVVIHPSGGGTGPTYHFTNYSTISCVPGGNPSPPPKTANCPNTFAGTATDSSENILSFTLVDNGEPSTNDYVSITITDSNGLQIAQGSGNVADGNLQVHCHGC